MNTERNSLMEHSSSDRIERKIQSLIRLRGRIFSEWASLVKQNERALDLGGESSPELVKQAERLLAEHDQIRNKIMRLIQSADGLKQS